MTRTITVPQLGESVIEATVGQWHKQEGDQVAVGDILVELETDKVDIEVGSETAGVLTRILHAAGDDVQIGDVLGEIEEGAAAPGTEAEETEEAEEQGSGGAGETEEAEEQGDKGAEEKPDAEAPTEVKPSSEDERVTPVARRMAEEQGVDLAQVQGSGTNGRITRQDIESYLQQQTKPAEKTAEPAPKAAPAPQPAAPARADDPREERVRLSRRRRTIAQRLVEAQHTAAMLTTFNDIDMGAVMDIRKRRQEAFQKRNDIKLGFMSFFVKAAVGALKAFPRLNAEIEGDDMILKHYYDIGMAVGAEEGLVVPVIRNADRKSFAQIEQEIKEYAQKAQDGSLSLDDLRGGTFTITNGGVFGSMLSTPILNPPQVGILGLHRIEERPIARNGEVIIRPMMYVALTYDHRIVDGSEAVRFLGRIKELIEDPEALLLEG